MSLPYWKNITSYAQGETDRTPRTWELTVNSLRLIVTRHRDYPPDRWLFRCAELGIISLRELNSSSIEEAKEEVLAIVHRRLAADLASIIAIEKANE